MLPRFTPAGHRRTGRPLLIENTDEVPSPNLSTNKKKALTPDGVRAFLELLPRFELGTSSLPRIPEASPLWGVVPLVIKSLETPDFGCSFSDR